MCLKSHTFIFPFLLGLDNVYLFFFSSYLVDRLAFPAIFVVYCFCSCDMRGDLVYIDVCTDVVFGDVFSILLQNMRLDIFGSLSSLIVAADERVLVVCHSCVN